MSEKYLDDSGLSYFWGKLKDYFQEKLVSGTNIKTINSQSLLGSGNITVGGGGGASVLDCYPVGSYYETSDSSFDPNVTWGGTWVLETPGQVHVSAGTGWAIDGAPTDTSDGGASTVKLQDTEMAHGHGFTQPAYSVTGGSVSNGITGGGHTHQYGYLTVTRGSGSSNTRVGPYGYTSSGVTQIGSSSETHTHNLPSHTHTVSRTTDGAVSNLSGASSTRTAHQNMPPYIKVNRWHRTA